MNVAYATGRTAGNAGAKSPPLYPAADPNVIAVTATDADDQLFKGSNRGRHVAVAAPGVDVLIAVPNGGYEVSTGTSFAAAEVSGIAALMLFSFEPSWRWLVIVWIATFGTMQGARGPIVSSLAVRNFGGRFGRTVLRFDAQGRLEHEVANI